MTAEGANLAGKRTVDARRLATLICAALVAVKAAACVTPLPGSPYEPPDDMMGPAAGAGGTVSAGGSSSGPMGSGGIAGPTGSAGSGPGPTGAAGMVAGPRGTAGAAGTVGCGLPLTINITPATSPPLTAGATFTFDVSVASSDAPGCPPRMPKVTCPSPASPIQLESDATPWFPLPLLSSQTEDALLQVTSSPGAPTGSYGFSCLDVNGGPATSAVATYVVGTGAATAAR